MKQKKILSGKYVKPMLFIAVPLVAVVLLLGLAMPETPATGTLSITVKYKGTPPAVPKINVAKVKSLCHIGDIPNETLIIGSGNAIKNAMVYVKGATGTASPKSYTLKNEGCVFKPHVGFAHKGGKLIMTNEDDVMHNTHAYFVVGKMKKTLLNTALPKGTKPITNTRALARTGLIKIQCDAHEWMAATIIVVDHPYYGTTNASGKTTISNVPAGEYDLVTYHGFLGEKTQKVKVEAGKTTTVTIELTK